MTPRPTRRQTIRTGLIVLVVAGAAVAAVFAKSPLLTALRPGDTIALHFTRDYKVEPYTTAVKLAGSNVGVVSGLAPGDDGGVVVTVKVDEEVRGLLGTEPTAEIRPTTVLGGKYYVSLEPGGVTGRFDADAIPAGRTQVPVELDRVLAAVPAQARAGLQGMVERLDSAFEAGTGESLARLLATAPDALDPAAVTLDALRGTHPDTDLALTVSHLDRTAQVLTATPGQLRSVVDELAATAAVLGDHAEPVAEAVDGLPAALRAGREGASRLAGTLDVLTETAADIRPAARELDPLLAETEPALARLRPVLADLRPLLADAQPLVEQLAPALELGTSVIDDVRGPVIERVNGPIVGQILADWHGEAPKYPGGGAIDSPFYAVAGYMFANWANATQYFNPTAHLLGFQPGVGTTSVYGTGVTARELQKLLTEWYGLPHTEPPLSIPPAEGVGLPVITEGAGG